MGSNRSFDELYEAIANAKDVEQQQTKEEYFEILEKIQKLADDSGESGVPINDLRQFVNDANEVFKKVLRPNEALLDAEVLKHVGTLGKTAIEKTQSSFITFKPVDFADKILSFIGEDGANSLCSDAWLRLGLDMESFSNRTQGLIPLYGALEWQRPERAPRERQTNTQEDTVVLRKTAERLEDLSCKERDTEDVNRVYNALKMVYKENGRDPILLLRFVIDPNSFSATIHNMFHVSFLIRDGYAQSFTDKDNLVVIVPVSKQKKDSHSMSGKTFQGIVDLDLEKVEEAKKLLKIRQPMIPAPSTATKRNRS